MPKNTAPHKTPAITVSNSLLFQSTDNNGDIYLSKLATGGVTVDGEGDLITIGAVLHTFTKRVLGLDEGVNDGATVPLRWAGILDDVVVVQETNTGAWTVCVARLDHDVLLARHTLSLVVLQLNEVDPEVWAKLAGAHVGMDVALGQGLVAGVTRHELDVRALVGRPGVVAASQVLTAVGARDGAAVAVGHVQVNLLVGEVTTTHVAPDQTVDTFCVLVTFQLEVGNVLQAELTLNKPLGAEELQMFLESTREDNLLTLRAGHLPRTLR